MSQSPRISIGMPVYNGAELVGEALDSILAQTYTDFELIICDNASTDGTEEICRAYAERDSRIRYIRHETNLGAAKNYNRTVELARGEYFRWSPHDDVVHPEFLARCVAELDSCGPDVCLCATNRCIMTYQGRVIQDGTTGAPDYHNIGMIKLLRFNPNDAPVFINALMRIESLRQTSLIGSYPHADLVLIAELRMAGRFVHIREPLFTSRLHNVTPEYRQTRLTEAGLAAWFGGQGTTVDSSEQRLRREAFAAVRRFPAPLWRKAIWYIAVMGMVLSRRMIPVKRSVFRTWSRLSLRACERTYGLSGSLRIWMCLSALRSRNVTMLGRALSLPWWGANIHILAFVADRISRRRDKWGPDEAAESLLVSWLEGPCRVRALAAARAMARHASRYEHLLREHIEQIESMHVIDSFEQHGWNDERETLKQLRQLAEHDHHAAHSAT